ncbi:MAG: LysR family transcriptional regulator [Verrucomicrobiales bacterium]|nr:LysR family transcriptional regulator [Verrucomicrobiales bacterium]
MNVHHLELFYYVAKYEGITPAVRRMPYGIQQPAVSGQMLNLERSLGTTLFQRRPFALTPAGEEMYAFVYPFFSRMEEMRGRICGEAQHHLRLAAPTTVLTQHLPGILGLLRNEFQDLRLTLKELPAPGAESALLKHEVDVAVTLCDEKTSPSVEVEKLIDLPLILLVKKGGANKNFEQLIQKAQQGNYRINEALVSLLPGETVAKLFQQGLAKKNIVWHPSVEVSTLELVLSYVQQGFGYGLSVAMPQAVLPKGIISIKLKDIPSLEIGLMYKGKLEPVALRFIEIVKDYAQKMLKSQNF